MNPIESQEDEFGALDVRSDARLAKLKEKANQQFLDMCEIIKKSEMALTGITEFLKATEANEKRFYNCTQEYVKTLKEIEHEVEKVRF